MRVLVVIPARKGSKRLTGKNMRMCAGKPLVLWVIEAAKQSWITTDILVLTDCKETAQLAKDHGIHVVDEPPELAGDKSADYPCNPTFYALESYVEQYPDRAPDVLVELVPSSPLVTGYDIDKSVVQLLGHPTAKTSLSVYANVTPWWGYQIDEKGLAVKINKRVWAETQTYPPTYLPNGCVHVYTKEVLVDPQLPVVDMVPFIMPKDRSVDINDLYDLELAEWLLLKKQARSDLSIGARFNNLHKGKRAWVFGLGPSLASPTDEQWALIDKDVTIGVNDIAAHHEVDYILAADALTATTSESYLKNKAKNIFMMADNYEIVEHIEKAVPFRKAHSPSSKYSDGLYIGGASAHAALNLALIMGCNPIILLGFDYDNFVHVVSREDDEPEEYWTQEHKQLTGFRDMVPLIKKLGRTVLNAQPDSKLNCFQKVSLGDVLYGETHRHLHRHRCN